MPSNLQQKADAGHFESMVLYLEKTQQERNLDANHLNQIVDKRQAQEPPASVLPPFAEEQVEDALESLSCPNSEAPHIDRELAAARSEEAAARRDDWCSCGHENSCDSTAHSIRVWSRLDPSER